MLLFLNDWKTDTRKLVIYLLIDPFSGEIRYVGKSARGPRRAWEKHGGYCGNWIKSLCRWPLVYVMCEARTEAELNDFEMTTIQYLRFQGCHLTNMTDGGDGAIGAKRSEQMKQRLREFRTGKICSEKSKSVTRKRSSKPVVCIDDGRRFPSMKDAALFYGVNGQCISRVCSGKFNHAGGKRFKWEDGY